MRWTLLLAAVFGVTAGAVEQPPARSSAPVQVVLLGTGSPPPDPVRSGPATAIVVNDTAYLVDLGPGVVRRAAAAAIDKGIGALAANRLQTAFITHLHSDHTVGYPDLIFTTWVQGAPGAVAGLWPGRPRRHDQAHHAGMAGRRRHQDQGDGAADDHRARRRDARDHAWGCLSGRADQV